MRDPREIDFISYERLEAMCAERQTMIHTLKRQIIELEAARDRALNDLRVAERDLRRKGCCDPGHQP